MELLTPIYFVYSIKTIRFYPERGSHYYSPFSREYAVKCLNVQKERNIIRIKRTDIVSYSSLSLTMEEIYKLSTMVLQKFSSYGKQVAICLLVMAKGEYGR